MATLNECGVSAKQSAACTEKCKTCQREGIPILPLRYAVIPKEKSKGRALLGAGVQGGSGTYAAADLGKNYKKNALKEHAYSLRTLRIGYVYVFLEATKVWEAYGVKPDGLLTQLKDPFKPAADALSAMKTVCYEADDNVPAAFINIKSIKDTPIIWLAFSQFAWEQGVFSNYAADATLRARRMTKLNLTELKTNPNQGDAFEIDEGLNTLANWVEEYAHPSVGTERYSWRVPNIDKVGTNTAIDETAKKALDKASWSTHPFPTRAIPLGKVAATVKAKKTQYKMPVIAVALDDVPGMLQELNFSKTRATIENNIWSLIDDRAHKVLSANATHGLEAYIKKQAKAKVWIQNAFNDGKNLKFNDKGDLEFADQVLTFAEYEDHVAKGHLPTTTHWEKKVGTVIPGRGQMGRVVDDSQKKADKQNSSQYEQFYNKLDKEKLKTFDNLYKPQLQKFNEQFKARDADMTLWLDHDNPKKTATAPFGLRGLCKNDCKEDNRFDSNYVDLVGSIFEGFQAHEHSLAWIEDTLQYSVESPEQILIRALVGNHTEWWDAVRGADNKNAKLYDISKQIVSATFKPHKKSRNTIEGLIGLFVHVGGKLADRLSKTTWLQTDRAVSIAGALTEDVVRQPVTVVKMPAADVEDVIKSQAASAAVAPPQAADGQNKSQSKAKTKRRIPSRIPKHIEISFDLWVAEDAKMVKAGATDATLEAAAAAVTGKRVFKGVTIKFKTKSFTLDGSSAKSWYAASLKNSANIALTRDGVLGLASLYFQWSGLRNAVKSYKDATLDQQNTAQLGLASAAFAMFGGSAEVVKALSNIVKEWKNDSKVLAGRCSAVSKWANRFSGGAGIIAGGIDTFGAFKQATTNYQEDDFDAMRFYLAAGAVGGASIYASVLILGGSTALFSGSGLCLFLGPVGWAIALGVITSLLIQKANECEDTAPGLWVAQNKYWGKGKKSFVTWKEEEDALYVIYYGLFASVEFEYGGPSISGDGLGRGYYPDIINVSINVARFTKAEQGWRYRLVGLPKKGLPIILDQIIHVQTDGFRDTLTVKPKSMETYRADGKQTEENNGLQLHRRIVISGNELKAVRLDFDFMADIDDQDTYAPIQLTAECDESKNNY